MKITIYKYPHPLEAGKWLYTGQTVNLTARDKRHHKATEGFGSRFKKMFPGVQLPKPDFQEVEVASHLEANFEETVAIFRNHTWYGQGGMNVTLPGSSDYKNLGRMGGVIGGRKSAESGHMVRIRTPESLTKGGLIQGRKNAESGHMVRIQKIGASLGGLINGRKNAESGQIQTLGKTNGFVQGRKNVESGHLVRVRELPQSIIARHAAGRKNVESGHLARARITALHSRWHTRRNIIKLDCKLCNPNAAQISETQAVAA